MSASWTYSYDDGPQTSFAAAKLSNLVRRRTAQAQDVASFMAPARAFDAAPLFVWGRSFKIYRDGLPWFAGRVDTNPTFANEEAESQSWDIAGPWYYLDHTIYMQSWSTKDPDTGALSWQYQSRVVLGQPRGDEAPAVSRINTGGVIRDVLEYCLEVNPGVFAIGTIGPDLAFPFEEVTDCACSEVIRRLLRWHPDVVVYFDYSETVPRINFRARSSLDQHTVDVGAGAPVAGFDLSPRHDLLPSQVALKYEIACEFDGQSFRALQLDVAPAGSTGRALNAIVFTIELAGFRTTILRQEIGTEFIATADSVPWWKKHLAWLNEVDLISISNASIEYEPALGSAPAPQYEILIGQVPDWMHQVVRKATFKAHARYRKLDGAVVVQEISHQDISVEVSMCDIDADITTPEDYDPDNPDDEVNRQRGEIFAHLVSEDYGEPVPSGLASSLYSALSSIQYEGNLRLQYPEVQGDYLGGRMSFAGGQAEWASMAAIVQEQTDDIDRGIVLVRFGPASHLGPTDLIQLFRLARRRVLPLASERRDDAGMGSRARVDIRDQGRVRQGGAGGSRIDLLRMRDADAPTKEILLDPSLLTADHQVLAAAPDGGVRRMQPGWLRYHD